MSTTTASSTRARLDAAGLAALLRPRITVLVALQAAAGFLLESPASLAPLGWLLAGTTAVAAGGCALNHWLERETDARMARTALRPLVTGALSPAQVALGGSASVLLGLALLLYGCGPLPTAIQALAALIYLGLYTPLKRRTSTNTWIGALPGALPLLAGAAAAGQGISLLSALMFLLVFTWQLPHFFAIASMYREQYRQGGLRMLSGDDPDDALLRWQMPMMVMSVLLVSVLPLLSARAGPAYAVAALLGGAAFLAVALAFRRRPDRPAARRVVVTSVIYLPLVLGTLVLDVACSRPTPGGPTAAATTAGDGSSGTAVEDGSGLPVLAVLPAFTLVDQDGRVFDRDALADGGRDPWVVDFVFTNCAGICIPMTHALKDLQQESLPARYLTISVDPERDSPQVLKAFREKWEGDAQRWTLAIGSHDELERLGEEGFKLTVQTWRTRVEGLPSLFHSGKFALVDTAGRVRGYYDHDDSLDLANLRADVARLVAAAPAAPVAPVTPKAPQADDAPPRGR